MYTLLGGGRCLRCSMRATGSQSRAEETAFSLHLPLQRDDAPGLPDCTKKMHIYVKSALKRCISCGITCIYHLFLVPSDAGNEKCCNN